MSTITPEQARAELERRIARRTAAKINTITRPVLEPASQQKLKKFITPEQARAELERRIARKTAAKIEQITKPVLEQKLTLPEELEQEEERKSKLNQHITIQDKLLSIADKETGAPFMTRLNAGVKATKQGQLGYLQKYLGKSNVFPVLDKGSGEINNFLVRDGTQGRWTVYDPKPENSLIGDLPGDIADIYGDVIEGVPAVAGGIAGAVAGPAGARIGSAIGGAAGNIFRQGQSALLPGDDKLTLAEREAMAINAGNLGAIGEAAGQALSVGAKAAIKGARKIGSKTFRNAQNWLAEKIPQTADEALLGGGKTGAELAREGLELTERSKDAGTGQVDLSLGQLTGSSKLRSLEEVLEANPKSMDIMHALKRDQLGKIAKYTDNTIDTLAKGETSAADAIKKASSVHEGYLNKLINNRAQNAKANFGEVNLAAKNKNVLGLKNTMEAIDAYAASREGIKGPQGKAIKNYLGQIRRDILNESGLSWAQIKNNKPALSAYKFQNSLREFGRLAKSGDSAAEKLDRSETKNINRAIFRALNKDLDEAIKLGENKPSSISSKLKSARDAYREDSKLIEQSRDVFLDKLNNLIKKDKSSLAPKELLKKNPEELTKISKSLRSIPGTDETPGGDEAANKLLGTMVRTIVNNSTSRGAGDEATKEGVVSMAKLASNLHKYKSKLNAMMPDDALGKQMLSDLSMFTQRISGYSPLGGKARTEALKQHSIFHGTGGTDSKIVAAAKKTGDKIFIGLLEKLKIIQSPEVLARALHDPEQIKLMLKLVGPRWYEQPVDMATRYATKILALQGIEPPENQDMKIKQSRFENKIKWPESLRPQSVFGAK